MIATAFGLLTGSGVVRGGGIPGISGGGGEQMATLAAMIKQKQLQPGGRRVYRRTESRRTGSSTRGTNAISRLNPDIVRYIGTFDSADIESFLEKMNDTEQL